MSLLTLTDNFSLLDSLNGRDEFPHLVSYIDENSLFPFSLTFKAAHKAVVNLKKPITTTWESVAHSISMIEWAMDNGCPPMEKIWLEEAGKTGNLELVRWLCENSFDGAWYCASDNVALYGHLHVLEWAYENKNIYFPPSLYSEAAKGGHIKVLEWAQKKKISPGDFYERKEVAVAAAQCCQRETLEWLRKNGFEWHSCVCVGAAKYGHLDLLKWLRDEGCPWDSRVYSYAAESGHFDVIKWAFDCGLEMKDHTDLCGYAARSGHLEIIKWARENGVPWGRYTMWWAAIYSHLDVLKWAHANGCTCSRTRSNRLSSSGVLLPPVSWDVIRWVEQNLGRI